MLAKFQENIAEFFYGKKNIIAPVGRINFFLSGYELNEVSFYTHYLI